jgi:hypothetical protein
MSRSILTLEQIVEILGRGETVYYKGKKITSLNDPDIPTSNGQILYDYPDWDLNPSAYSSANAVGIDGYPIEGSPSNGNTIVFDSTDRVWKYGASGGGSGSITLSGDVTGTGSGTISTSISGLALNKLAAITGSRAIVSNTSGVLAASATTSTEISYLSGVTSSIQTQINSKMTTSTYDGNADGYVENSSALKILVHNTTGSIVPKGSIVYISGATGTHPTIALAQANSDLTSSKTIGAVVNTLNIGDVGEVIVQGTLDNQDTSLFSIGDTLWLSPTEAGKLTTTKPQAPSHAVFVGYVARVNTNNGRIVYKIINGFELEELHNVLINEPATGQALIYNNTTKLWSNQNITLSIPGSTGDYLINSGSGLGTGILNQSSGRLTSTPTAVSSGVIPYLRIVTPPDTGLTASTEAPGIVFGGDGSGSTVTRTRAAGAVTTQREYIFTAPTYAAASATTITTAATLAITGAPVSGSNVTLTNRYAMLVDAGSGTSRLQTNQTGTSYQLELHNESATGISGLRWMADATSTAFVWQYDKASNNVLFSFGPGISGARTFTINSNETMLFGSTNGGSRISIGNNLVSDVKLRVCNAAVEPALTLLSVDQTTSSPTVDVFRIRDQSTVRYGYFYNTTESRGRIFDPNGGQQTRGTLTENVTLDIGNTWTNTTIQIPANSLVLGVTVRVTTTITGIDSTSLQIGDATTAARFGSIAAFTAGTTGVGLNHLQGGISTDAAGPIVTSATAVRLTLAGGADNTPTAGAVRVTIHYISLTASTS